MPPKTIYFLCTGNSCRSQMAEGLAKDLFKDQAQIFSAGILAAGVNPRAIDVMNELGIDISTQTSDVIDEKILKEADYIITLCGNARDNCPVVQTNATKLHWDMPDPINATGTEEEIHQFFREVRDKIKKRILTFKNEIQN